MFTITNLVSVLLGFYPRDVYVSAVLATATWLDGWVPNGWVAGWLAVTRRYCIKTVKSRLS